MLESGEALGQRHPGGRHQTDPAGRRKDRLGGRAGRSGAETSKDTTRPRRASSRPVARRKRGRTILEGSLERGTSASAGLAPTPARNSRELGRRTLGASSHRDPCVSRPHRPGARRPVSLRRGGKAAPRLVCRGHRDILAGDGELGACTGTAVLSHAGPAGILARNPAREAEADVTVGPRIPGMV